MGRLLDPWMGVWTVFALIPNLLVILWAVARLSTQVRVLSSQVESIERELQMNDAGVSQLVQELRRQRERAVTPPPRTIATKPVGG